MAVAHEATFADACHLTMDLPDGTSVQLTVNDNETIADVVRRIFKRENIDTKYNPEEYTLVVIGELNSSRQILDRAVKVGLYSGVFSSHVTLYAKRTGDEAASFLDKFPSTDVVSNVDFNVDLKNKTSETDQIS